MTNGDEITPAAGASALPSDPAGRVSHYTRLVDEKEDPDAMCALAGMLRTGAEGVPADIPRAVELLQRGVHLDHAGCRDALMAFLSTVQPDREMKDAAMGMLGPGDDEEGDTAPPGEPAEDADAETLCNHATLLETGDGGVAADPAKAVVLYERAIERYSNEECMNNLAILLEAGADGVPKDVPRAVKLYERAIDEGDHCEAMFNLAVLLVKGGDGVEKDAKTAKELYVRAMEEGEDVDAMKNLCVLLREGAEGVPKDEKEADAIYKRLQKMGAMDED